MRTVSDSLSSFLEEVPCQAAIKKNIVIENIEKKKKKNYDNQVFFFNFIKVTINHIWHFWSWFLTQLILIASII